MTNPAYEPGVVIQETLNIEPDGSITRTTERITWAAYLDSLRDVSNPAPAPLTTNETREDT